MFFLSSLEERFRDRLVSRRRRWSRTAALLSLVVVVGVLLAGCASGVAGTGAGTTSILGLSLLAITLTGFLAGCGGGGTSTGSFTTGQASGTTSTTTTTTTPATLPATGLRFVTSLPGTAQRSSLLGVAATVLAPVTVAVVDATGKTVTSATNAITISLDQNPAHATLTGTLTRNAVSGVATFNDLKISLGVPGYTFKAVAAGLASGLSTSFTVGALPLAYQTPLPTTVVTGAVDLVSADFNGDGNPDLGSAGPVAAQVELGNGNGTFSGPQNLSTNGEPYSLVAGDFNGDGKSDVVVGSYITSNLSVMLGNGDGTFAVGANVAASRPATMAVGDFNHDGKLDLVTASSYRGLVQVFLGNGDGTFAAPINIAVPAVQIVVGDFNGDGNEDIATVGGSLANSAFVCLGNGNGTFKAPVAMAAGSFPQSLTAADFNGDGHLDLAVVDGLGSQVSVYLGNGDGTFKSPTDIALAQATEVVAADMNLDTMADLVVTEGNGQDSILLGNGDGSFQAPYTIAVGLTTSDSYGLVVDDFNHDGRPDIAQTQQSLPTLYTILHQ